MTLPTNSISSAGSPSARNVSTASLRRGEEQVGKAVGDDAVDFFGHRAVIASEAGFDMRDTYPQLRRDQGRRGREFTSP